VNASASLVAGGLVGAGLGALIGSRIRVGVRQNASPLPHLGGVHNRGFLLIVSIGPAALKRRIR